MSGEGCDNLKKISTGIQGLTEGENARWTVTQKTAGLIKNATACKGTWSPVLFDATQTDDDDDSDNLCICTLLK